MSISAMITEFVSGIAEPSIFGNVVSAANTAHAIIGTFICIASSPSASSPLNRLTTGSITRMPKISAMITEFVSGIAEPSIFGVCFKEKTPLIGNIFGCMIAGTTGSITRMPKSAVIKMAHTARKYGCRLSLISFFSHLRYSENYSDAFDGGTCAVGDDRSNYVGVGDDAFLLSSGVCGVLPAARLTD